MVWGASAICGEVVCKRLVAPASGVQSSGARETRALQNANMLAPTNRGCTPWYDGWDLPAMVFVK